MLFTSYTFIAFLAVLVIAYYLIPRKYQWMLLLLGSYFFYAFSGPKNFAYIVVTTVSTYLCAGKISSLWVKQKKYMLQNKEKMSTDERKAYKAGVKKKQRVYLLIALILNFGLLLVLKILGGLKGFILPLGISFYTLTAMGYLIDVYRGTYESEKNIGKFALFLSFFPQIIQGPITRYSDMSKTLFEEHRFKVGMLIPGLERIIWGFFKKLVIADRLLPAVKTLIADPGTYGGVYVFIALVFYATQLYADFTGGIDITIGIAQMLGIDMKENFIRPFFSKNLAEYWRRWHISLGKWFTDYVFYPISVAVPMLKTSSWIRTHVNEYLGKRFPVYASSIAVWFLTGLWHGTGLNFIVWGLANGVILIISQELDPLYRKFHQRFKTGRVWDAFTIARTLFITGALRMLDLYRNVGLTFTMLFNMVFRPNFAHLSDGTLGTIGITLTDVIIVFLGVILMLTVSLIGRKDDPRRRMMALPAIWRYAIYFALFIVVLVFGAYGIGYDSSQFIYNQF